MSAPFGDDDHYGVVRCELDGVPTKERRRPRTQVDGHVPNNAPNAPDQLHFGVRRTLIVQPANGPALQRTRVVDLHDLPIAEHGSQVSSAEKSCKAAP